MECETIICYFHVLLTVTESPSPVFPSSPQSGVCVEDLKCDVELQTRTQAQRCFVMWPVNVNKDEEGKKKQKKPTALAVKLNKRLLIPFVGFSEFHKKLGLVPFIEPLLVNLNHEWKAACWR